MEIIRSSITREYLSSIAENIYGDMVKAVVDVEREIMAVNAELHSDLEAVLLEDGSFQENLWGINIYPEFEDEEFIEFDSLINIRPKQGNRSRGVEPPELRDRIIRIVRQIVKKQS